MSFKTNSNQILLFPRSWWVDRVQLFLELLHTSRDFSCSLAEMIVIDFVRNVEVFVAKVKVTHSDKCMNHIVIIT